MTQEELQARVKRGLERINFDESREMDCRTIQEWYKTKMGVDISMGDACNLWQSMSGDFAASWLIVDESSLETSFDYLMNRSG